MKYAITTRLHTANQRISVGGNRASLEATCFVLGNNYFLHLCLFFFSPLTLRYSAFAAFAAATAALLLLLLLLQLPLLCCLSVFLIALMNLRSFYREACQICGCASRFLGGALPRNKSISRFLFAPSMREHLLPRSPIASLHLYVRI